MSETRSITFTLVLCIVCSLLLTSAATLLKDRQSANIRLDKQKNILKAAGLLEEKEKIDSDKIEEIFKESIVQVEGKNFYLLIDSESKELKAYILPVESKGLWGKIYGFLAMKKDGKTVSGFTIYEHKETPGLGGEIEGYDFLKQFKDKEIVDKSGVFKGLRVSKGKALTEDKHQVDGISGATLTGNLLSEGLMQSLKDYEEVSENFRKGKGHIYIEAKEAP